MLGLIPEGDAQLEGGGGKPAGKVALAPSQGFLQPLESLLPLRTDWAYLAVRAALPSIRTVSPLPAPAIFH